MSRRWLRAAIRAATATRSRHSTAARSGSLTLCCTQHVRLCIEPGFILVLRRLAQVALHGRKVAGGGVARECSARRRRRGAAT